MFYRLHTIRVVWSSLKCIHLNKPYMANITLRKNSPRSNKRPMRSELQPGPSAASIRFILDYSKALRVVHAPPVGEVTLILN